MAIQLTKKEFEQIGALFTAVSTVKMTDIGIDSIIVYDSNGDVAARIVNEGGDDWFFEVAEANDID